MKQTHNDKKKTIDQQRPDTDSVGQLHEFLTSAYPPENYDDQELDAIYNFTSGVYAPVNDLLSGGGKEAQGDETVNATISGLDSAIAKSKAPSNFIIYTKIDASSGKSLKEGSTFRFKGFRSTTIDIDQLLGEKDGGENYYILKIMIKKNNPGIYVSDLSANPDEHEFILPRGIEIQAASDPKRVTYNDQPGLGNVFVGCVIKK
jgi:hypothetical protein